MKLLWLISNWKRTGPVEPSLDLAAAVAARGHKVTVMVGRAPEGLTDNAASAAEARGLKVVDAGLALGKHRSPLRDRTDAKHLRGYLAKSPVDCLVTTLPNAHRIARRGRPAGCGITYVSFEMVPMAVDGGDLCLACVPGAFLGPRTEALKPALDIDVLTKSASDPAGARAALGVEPDTFLFGIVARMQTHRKFEVLWEAVDLLSKRDIPFHLVTIGRGTNQETVAFEPVRERGLNAFVSFPGYLRGDAYGSLLAALDTQLFLVPGSDPTCRALREGQALGVPSLVTSVPPLPALVEAGVSGTVVAADDALAMADAMALMATDLAATRAMGAAAKRLARDQYDAKTVADAFLSAIGA